MRILSESWFEFVAIYKRVSLLSAQVDQTEKKALMFEMKMLLIICAFGKQVYIICTFNENPVKNGRRQEPKKFQKTTKFMSAARYYYLSTITKTKKTTRYNLNTTILVEKNCRLDTAMKKSIYGT